MQRVFFKELGYSHAAEYKQSTYAAEYKQSTSMFTDLDDHVSVHFDIICFI